MDQTSTKNISAKKRLEILDTQFTNSIKKADINTAKSLIFDIQPILKKLGKNAKLVEYRNYIFELAMEIGDYEYAIEGFLANKKIINPNTRLYLEATALLAVCFLRKGDFPNSQEHIKEVLTNKKVIKTEATRIKFNKEVIERFNEESVILTIKTDKLIGKEDQDEMHRQALLLEQTKDTAEIYAPLGKSLPKSSKEILFLVDSFSKKQLSYEERKQLPSSEDVIQNDKIGKTVFNSFTRVLYKSLCEPTSEVYKAWYTYGIGAFRDKKLITTSVLAALAGFGIAGNIIIISVIALVMRFGIDIYCDMYKPKGLMEIRGKK